MPTTTKVMLICSAAVFLLAVGGFIWLGTIPAQTPPTEALPMLVRDLPSDVDKAKSAFQRRVHAQYPNGIGASALADDLRRKGFHLHGDRKSDLVIANLEQHEIPCVSDWVIHWSMDGQNRAQNIGAYFNYACP